MFGLDFRGLLNFGVADMMMFIEFAVQITILSDPIALWCIRHEVIRYPSIFLAIHVTD